MMAKDPAFLFYPGDYLRDTQCLSESVQVAYDRIMCEHMRNICISQQQLNFFTKRLNDAEKEELMTVLKQIDCGYQIEWVAISIENRRAYSESRRKNRQGSTKEHMNNISSTYVEHMENENENVIDIKKRKEKKLTKREPETHALNSYIHHHFPETVAKMPIQMTAQECEKLKASYTSDFIISVLNEMSDWELLLSKRKDVYKTFRTFARNKEQGFKK